MWIWGSKTGALLGRHLTRVGFGYAGHAAGINNPSLSHVPNVGPLPTGFYTIEAPEDHPELGPYVLRLIPDASNVMHGRSGFYIHGERKDGPQHEASHGCIVLGPMVRRDIWEAADQQDHRLRVVDI